MKILSECGIRFSVNACEIEFCQEYKYLGVIFDTSGTDEKEIRSRVIEARKCVDV